MKTLLKLRTSFFIFSPFFNLLILFLSFFCLNLNSVFAFDSKESRSQALSGKAIFEETIKKSEPLPEKKNEENQKPTDKKDGNKTKKTSKNLSPTSLKQDDDSSNLPQYFKGSSSQKEIKAQVILPDNKDEKLFSLAPGEELEIEVFHSIIAFPDEQTPIAGRVISNKFKGAKLLGSTRLEKNSRRIFISFSRLNLNSATYEIKATALTNEGQSGFIGDYHSRELEYFSGDFIASMTAAYFDGLVPKNRTFLGTIEDTSVDSAFKKGLSSGALSTANLFKEKLKKTPEFSELKGPFKAKLLIEELGKRL